MGNFSQAKLGKGKLVNVDTHNEPKQERQRQNERKQGDQLRKTINEKINQI